MKVIEISSTMKNFERLTQMCYLHAAGVKDTSMTFILGGR
jgi:hypothetical protein